MSEDLKPAITPLESAPTAQALTPTEASSAGEPASRIGFEPGSTRREPDEGRPERTDRSERSDRTSSRPRPHAADRAGRSDPFERSPRASVVALIDAEFWRWWQDTPSTLSERETAIRARQTVRDALAQARDSLQLQRIVWVCEKPLHGLDDLRAITVSQNEDDDGWPLVRALSQALFDLASGGVINTVLLATDDDRLLPAMDEVQRRGLRVLVLQGEDKKLSDEWRRLLRVADRALVPGEARGSNLGSGRAGRGADDRTARPRDEDSSRSNDERGDESRSDRDRNRISDETHEPPTAEVLQTLNESAGQWWSDLDESSRASLREAIPQSRGLPRDFDRQLLIAAARTLDRQLSVPEKHALRGAARALASAAGPADQKLGSDDNFRPASDLTPV